MKSCLKQRSSVCAAKPGRTDLMPRQLADTDLLADTPSFPTKMADVILLPSADDPANTDPWLSADIHRFEAIVGNAAHRRQTMCFSTSAPQVAHWAGDYLIMISPIATGLIGAAGAWFASKSGRKIRLRVGDVEAEASTIEDVQFLIERGFELRKTDPPSKP